MASAENAVLRQLGRLFVPGTVAGLSEWQLLSRYVTRRDEAAFEALVARHGPMVLGVCRRVLHDPNDVDDAFQATFLVLVKKANSLGERDAIGHWLYGVAYRVALRARAQAADRRRREARVDAPGSAPEADPARGDLASTLDEELGRLPAKYRAPIVLCYIEGLTHEEAAGVLGWPLGSVKGRLARARDLLKARLTRRGVAPAAPALGAWLAGDAQAAVPEPLLHCTVAAAMRLAEGPLTDGTVSAAVAGLLEGVLSAMYWTKLKTAAMAAMLIVGLLAMGAGVVAQQGSRPKTGPAEGPAAVVLQPVAGAEPTIPGAVPTEEPADPSAAPTNAGAKSLSNADSPSLGDTDRQQRQIAEEIFRRDLRNYTDNASGDVARLAQWSRRIADTSGSSRTERRKALAAHLERISALQEHAKRRVVQGQSFDTEPLVVAYYIREAKRLIAQAEEGTEEAVPGGGRSDDTSRDNLKTRAILAKLEEPVSMSFANETPLEDVLKYIKSATTSPKDNGIPIYVDPVGLQVADRTMTSPVSLDLEGVPLRTTLSLLLKQLGLTYRVKEGLMTITAEELAADEEETPLKEMHAKARRGELDLAQLKELTETYKTLIELEKLRQESRKSINGAQIRAPRPR